MGISPDTKDWTWVLERPCPDCGFDVAAVEYEQIPGMALANAKSWQAVLGRPDVTTRPDEVTWSALEYAAHVRDVCRIIRTRLALMLGEDDPLFPSWDQDATAVAERYHEQDPRAVARELSAAASEVAEAFGSVGPSRRARTGRRSDGASFTVETLAKYFVHDLIHHLWDVRGPNRFLVG